MKKSKRPQEDKAAAAVAPRKINWWPWVLGFAALVLAFQVYAPALNGHFVLDDRYLPFFSPDITPDLSRFVNDLRPLLMFSFWIDYRLSYEKPETMSAQFHDTNVVIHALVSILVALIVLRLVDWAGVKGRMRVALAIFCGLLFMLHPLQTESVAYVASRSELLSVLFYYAAFAVFIYRNGESITLGRTVAVLALFGAAVAVKEHTLTLPLLLVLTDYYWAKGSIVKNRILYGTIAVIGAAGAVFVARVLAGSATAGFHVQGMTPLDFFFTQGRVLWIYLRMFVAPYGQNIDPDIAVSHGPFAHGAIFGLIAMAALVAAAWMYRKRFPLASYGIFVFLLLIAPTASIVPLRDPLAEHRMYLPFLGLALVCAEFLRRLRFQQVVTVGAVALAACAVLTYRRAEVWGNSLTLWQDSVNKSPNKYRPRFQLAYTEYEAGSGLGNPQLCVVSTQNYAIAARMQPVTDDLLIDWGLALGCAGQWRQAIDKFNEAAQLNNTAHVHTQIAMAWANLKQFELALDELAHAEQIDAAYDMTYVYRGQIYEYKGDKASAAREYKHACDLKPTNKTACDGYVRMLK